MSTVTRMKLALVRHAVGVVTPMEQGYAAGILKNPVFTRISEWVEVDFPPRPQVEIDEQIAELERQKLALAEGHARDIAKVEAEIAAMREGAQS